MYLCCVTSLSSFQSKLDFLMNSYSALLSCDDVYITFNRLDFAKVTVECMKGCLQGNLLAIGAGKKSILSLLIQLSFFVFSLLKLFF